MNRRKFLSGSLAASAAAAAAGLRVGRGGFGLLGQAHGAPPPGLLATPYPTVVIMLHGGLDPAMHLLAVPNGTKFGTLTFENRMSGTAGIKDTTSGLRYFEGSVAATGKADFVPHLPDVAMLRAFRGAQSHDSIAMAWYGQYSEGQKPNKPRRMPWAHYVASKFRAAGDFVPKPCAVAYPNQDLSAHLFLDFAAYGNQSPDPSVATERVLTWKSFFDSLAITGTGIPSIAEQNAVYALTRGLNGGTYAATQPDIRGSFDSATGGADKVLSSVYGGQIWPAPANVLTALGATSASLAAPISSKDTQFPAFFTFAFQALQKNLSHVIGLNSFGIADKLGLGIADNNLSWDTHTNNYKAQMALGQEFWPALGKFIALLKLTDSHIPGKKLFDTTNIWIQSDMGRAPYTQADGDPAKEKYRTGTQHWPDCQAMFLGGRFKRGKVIGAYGPKYRSTPIDLTTGGQGTVDVNFDHLVATVIKASGIDPAGYTNAAPIDALIDMSL